MYFKLLIIPMAYLMLKIDLCSGTCNYKPMWVSPVEIRMRRRRRPNGRIGDVYVNPWRERELGWVTRSDTCRRRVAVRRRWRCSPSPTCLVVWLRKVVAPWAGFLCFFPFNPDFLVAQSFQAMRRWSEGGQLDDIFCGTERSFGQIASLLTSASN